MPVRLQEAIECREDRMARTSMEFQMKNGIEEAIHGYLTNLGYELRVLNGCPLWLKENFLGRIRLIIFRMPVYSVFLLCGITKI